MQRVCTLPRDHQDSEPVGWISGHTRIGPVLQIRVICRLDQYGIEIQVPSTSKNGPSSWIVMSRGPNRHADESWHDQDDSHQNVEMVIVDLSKTGAFNTFSEESKKTIQKLGKIELLELAEVSVLARKTVILHLRDILKAFERTEAQDKGKN